MNPHPHLHPDPHAHISASPLTEDHLTADQIDDHLIGDLAAAPAVHLAACPLCGERAAAAAGPLTSFQSVTMAWSERRSATLPIPGLSLGRPLWQRPIVSFAVCFCFVLGMAITNATLQFPMETAAPQPALQETAPSAPVQQAIIHSPAPAEASSMTFQRDAQLSADNHMLRAIDAEFDASPDSAAELGIVTALEPAAPASTLSSVQD